MILLANGINRLTDSIGRLTSFLVLPLVMVVAYEVVMRYAFNAPTIWAFEATSFIYGIHFALGFAYTHRHNGHVAIDVFEARMNPRPRAILRMLTNLGIFIPTIGLLSYYATLNALTSMKHWERASTSWSPPIYPFKFILAAGFALLLLQGISKLIDDSRLLRSTATPENDEGQNS